MTTDLTLLIGPDQKWRTTEGFLEAMARNLEKNDGIGSRAVFFQSLWTMSITIKSNLLC